MICTQCKKRPACPLFVGTYAGWCGKCVRGPGPLPTVEEVERTWLMLDQMSRESGFGPSRIHPRLRAIRTVFEASLERAAADDD